MLVVSKPVRQRPTAGLAAAIVLCVAAVAGPALASPIAIASARSLPLGSTVTLRGSVTVPSAVFESGTFDKGFAIQDRTGGIYVSIASDLGFDLRDEVEVEGQLADSFGLLILNVQASDVRLYGQGRPVRAQQVATSGLSEATEGRLLRLRGTLTQPVVDDLPYGYRLFVDDGSGEAQVFVYASTGIDVSSLAVGQTLRVVGFGAQFDTHYELNPRLPSDIVVLGH